MQNVYNVLDVNNNKCNNDNVLIVNNIKRNVFFSKANPATDRYFKRSI